MSRAGVTRVLCEDYVQDGGRFHLAPEAFFFRIHRAQDRQCVETGDLVIVRILLVEIRHRVRIRPIAIVFFSVSVQDLERFEEGLLFISLGFRDPSAPRRG